MFSQWPSWKPLVNISHSIITKITSVILMYVEDQRILVNKMALDCIDIQFAHSRIGCLKNYDAEAHNLTTFPKLFGSNCTEQYNNYKNIKFTALFCIAKRHKFNILGPHNFDQIHPERIHQCTNVLPCFPYEFQKQQNHSYWNSHKKHCMPEPPFQYRVSIGKIHQKCFFMFSPYSSKSKQKLFFCFDQHTLYIYSNKSFCRTILYGNLY
jgi:hypothetical protein